MPKTPDVLVTEKEITQVVKILEKLIKAKDQEGKDYYALGEKQIIDCVRKWAKWYGVDYLSMEFPHAG